MRTTTDPALLTILQHREIIHDLLQALASTLTKRGRLHDLTKLHPNEFEGAARLAEIGKKYPFGSKEAKKATEDDPIAKQYLARHLHGNRHHPEYHQQAADMSFIDIIEMVCDWEAASIAYGGAAVVESLDTQFSRFNFTSEQEWLIEEVANWLTRNPRTSATPKRRDTCPTL